jgi:hypothetical protein
MPTTTSITNQFFKGSYQGMASGVPLSARDILDAFTRGPWEGNSVRLLHCDQTVEIRIPQLYI